MTKDRMCEVCGIPTAPVSDSSWLALCDDCIEAMVFEAEQDRNGGTK